MLGFDVIRSVVTIANFYSEFSGNPAREHLLDRLAKRSFTIAAVARGIANAEGVERSEADKAFCAGLLAHIGTLVIIANLPDLFERATELADNNEISIVDAESQVIGATHAEVGAYLLGLWGFDMTVIEAVGQHHGIGATTGAKFGISSIVHAAQYLTWECGHPTSIAAAAPLDKAHFEACGKAGRIEAWRDICRAMCLEEAAAS
jgi:HD-like signal output (HDOD) protein